MYAAERLPFTNSTSIGIAIPDNWIISMTARVSIISDSKCKKNPELVTPGLAFVRMCMS